MDAIRARKALERILSSEEFAQSKRSAEILRYVVEQLLQGKQEEIKERVIGADVFGRTPDYDVKVDSIVRVEARRLRSKLAEYYSGSGAREAEQFRLPTGTYVPELVAVDADPGDRQRGMRYWRWVAAIAGVAIVGGTIFWLSPAKHSEITRMSITVPVGEELTGGIAITSAGDEIAYTASRQGTTMAYRRKLTKYEPEIVAGSEGTVALAYSHDGSMLAICSEAKLAVYSIASREMQKLANSECTREVVWSHRGTLFSRASSGVLETPIGGGAVRLILENRVTPKGFEYLGPIREADDGRLLIGSSLGPQDRHLEWVEPGTGARTPYLDKSMGGPILANGEVVTFWNGVLRAGNPSRIVSEGVASASWFEGSADASRNGTLVYLPQGAPAERRLVWVDLAGKVTPVPVPMANSLPLDISSDGRSALVSRQDSAEAWSVWLYPIGGGEWTKLLTGTLPRASAVWEAGGRSAIVASDITGDRFVNLHRIWLDKGSRPERLTNEPHYGQYPQAVNGPWLLYQEGVKPGRGSDIYQVRLDDPKAKPREFAADEDWESEPAIHPGGKLVAYAGWGGGKTTIRLRPFPEPSGKDLEFLEPEGRGPLWSPDGKQLYFYRANEGIFVMNYPGGSPKLKIAGTFIWEPDGWGRTAALHPDGKRFLLAQPVTKQASSQELRVVFNAFPVK